MHSETFFVIGVQASPAKRQGASADKLHAKPAEILSLVGLARSKQDPVNRGHGAQYLQCAPLAWNLKHDTR